MVRSRCVIIFLFILFLTRHTFSQTSFRRGDVDSDGRLQLADVLFTLNWFYLDSRHPECEKTVDVNDDGSLNLTDPIYSLFYLFLSGEKPPTPFEACGIDPTEDTLSCERYSPCSPEFSGSYGVLLEQNFSCTLFVSDSGDVFALNSVGEQKGGDRVYVAGTVVENQARNCNGGLAPILDNTILPAFAGTGIVGRSPNGSTILEVNENEIYLLSEDGEFEVGAEVFVKGKVKLSDQPDGLAEIEAEVIGAKFSQFGRLRSVGGSFHLNSESQTYPLDSIGVIRPREGDYVFVEGWTEAKDNPDQNNNLSVRVRDNTTRRAFEMIGNIIEVNANGIRFKANNQVFDNEYSLPANENFKLGDRVFVRGRRLDDYDPLEDRESQFVRLTKLDQAFSSCGLLNNDGDPVVLTDNDGLVDLEYSGEFQFGDFVYVAGALEQTELPGELKFSHNIIHSCISTSGQLQQGFHCTPVFVSDEDVGFGNVFVLENYGGQQTGDRFCVEGPVLACSTSCPFPCITENSVDPCDL